MICVEYLNKYDKIFLWGYVPKKIDKYLQEIDNSKLKILDLDPKKKGWDYKNVYVDQVYELEKVTPINAAVIILVMESENEIYNNIRRLGFKGDVYSDNMVCQEYKNDITENFNEIGAYTIERHTQLLIALLKKYEIKDVVVSPGVCNMNFVYSLQSDDFFNLISCIDERSAGYMACGIAQTTGKPVVLSCTGATASRNYMSALTEAYYSEIPILAVTSSRDSFMIDNGIEQITDRYHAPKDTSVYNIEIANFNGEIERKYCELKINRALNKLFLHGGGPVHINLITRFSKDFSVRTLPECNVIKNIRYTDAFPDIRGRVALLLKPNRGLNKRVRDLIEKFSKKYNVVIIGDNLSNYDGSNFVNISLLQLQQNKLKYEFDILISVGTVTRTLELNSKVSWRISEDGKMEDLYLNLVNNFDMPLDAFLIKYVEGEYGRADNTTFDELNTYCLTLKDTIPDLPFSNLWAARYTSSKIPVSSVCYMGIFSSLRNWNIFPVDKSIKCFSTVGGFGIDGTMSALIGAALVGEKDKLYFGFFGELSFYYDMNVLGNKKIGNNVRIMVFNNDGGNSLLYQNGLPVGLSMEYVAALGHYKTKTSESVIESYVQALGFKYIYASNKEEYIKKLPQFLELDTNKPVIFELKYSMENDFKAVDIITHLSING